MLLQNLNANDHNKIKFIPQESSQLYVRGLIEIEGKELSEKSKGIINEIIKCTTQHGLSIISQLLNDYDISATEAP